MCKECLCCGFWSDGGGAWEAGGRMSDASQDSVGRYFEITKKRCSLWFRKRKQNRYQVPGTGKHERSGRKEGTPGASSVGLGSGVQPAAQDITSEVTQGCPAGTGSLQEAPSICLSFSPSTLAHPALEALDPLCANLTLAKISSVVASLPSLFPTLHLSSCCPE